VVEAAPRPAWKGWPPRRTASGGAVALLFATAYAEDLQVCAIIKRARSRRVA